MSTKSKSKALAVIASLIGTLLAAPSAGAFDPTPPVLVSATVSPTTLPESGGPVIVTIVVSSPAYGLARPPAIMFRLNTNLSRVISFLPNDDLGRVQNFVVTTLVSGDAKSGTYRATANFAAPIMPGVYGLTILELEDAAQNRRDLIQTSATVTVIAVAAPTPTPTPSATASPTSTPSMTLSPTTAATSQIDLAEQLLALQDQVARLTAANAALANQVTILKNASSLSLAVKLQAKLAKICAVRPKPKGC
jgi:hypothetical protein